MVLKTFKMGLGVVLHPSRETNVSMGLKEALLTYYKFAAIPITLTLAASLFVMFTLPGVLSSAAPSQLVDGSVTLTLLFYRQYLFSLVVTPLLIPIALFVIAGVLHVVGKTLRIFQGGFSKTFAAVLYAEFSSLLVWFLLPIGGIGSIIYLLAFLYGVYVLVVGLSKQHKTTMTNAFVVGLVVFVLLSIIASAYISSYAASALQGGTVVPTG